jgi:apolipoprotein N-acyltransferase
VFTVVYGLIRLPAIDAVTAGADKLTVGMVQTNLGSHGKTTSPAQFMRQHLDMSPRLVRRRPDLDLLVWPESVYDGLIRKDGSQPANQAIAALGTPTIMGALTIDDANHDGEAKYFNSIVLISGKGELLSWFDKVELLAFGETLPLSRLIPQSIDYSAEAGSHTARRTATCAWAIRLFFPRCVTRTSFHPFRGDFGATTARPTCSSM